MFTVDLPKPISTNRLFKNKRRGRASTQEYNTWKWHASALINDQKKTRNGFPKPNGPIKILFAVGEVGLSANMDGDNCLKCLQDALVDSNIIPEDNRKIVRSVGMEWVEGMKGAKAYIFGAEELPNVHVSVPYGGVVS